MIKTTRYATKTIDEKTVIQHNTVRTIKIQSLIFSGSNINSFFGGSRLRGIPS